MAKTPYIKNDQGLYQVRGYVSQDTLVQIAADILLESLAGQENLTKPDDAVRFLQLSLAKEKNEHFGVLFLNNKHQVISFERMLAKNAPIRRKEALEEPSSTSVLPGGPMPANLITPRQTSSKKPLSRWLFLMTAQNSSRHGLGTV